jgi:4-hydroxy-tetrahydrodipicolinate synthase
MSCQGKGVAVHQTQIEDRSMVEKHPFWSRVFTFVPTPLTDDGEALDEDGLRRVLDHQIENSVDGVCVFGSTGGNGSFSEEEMMRGMEVAARHVDRRIALIAGTGARTTAGCTRLSKQAEAVGCDGVMILPMTYWPLTLDEVREHYARVSDAISLPICVYNNPWTTGIDMPPEFLAELARHENVSCVKESTGDLSRISAIRRLTGEDVAIIAGWESTSLQAFSAGATGWAPVVTNFLPQDAMAFFRAAVYDDDIARAREIWDRLFPICEMICAKSHIRVGHTGLDILGRPVGPPRRPLRLLNDQDRAALQDVLIAAGALDAAGANIAAQ